MGWSSTKSGLDRAAEAQVDVLGSITGREDSAEAVGQVGWDCDIVNLTRLLVVKVGVLVKVRAVASRLPDEIDLFDQAALDESVEAVVNGRERDRWHRGFDTGKDLFSRRMIAFFKNYLVNHFPLWRGAQAAIGKVLRERDAFGIRDHCDG